MIIISIFTFNYVAFLLLINIRLKMLWEQEASHRTSSTITTATSTATTTTTTHMGTTSEEGMETGALTFISGISSIEIAARSIHLAG